MNRSSYSLHVTLFSDADEMYDLWLPQGSEGLFHFSDAPEHRFLSIASRGGQWVARCRRPVLFCGMDVWQGDELLLTPEQTVSISADERMYVLYVECAEAARQPYISCLVENNTAVRIGSQAECEVCCSQLPPLATVLRRNSGQWSVEDRGSPLGAYVNRIRTTGCNLKLGDHILISGLRLIVGSNFVAISAPKDSVHINPMVLQDLAPAHSGYGSYEEQESELLEEALFNRLPRKRLDVQEKTVALEGPPMSMSRTQIPLMLRMGSSAVSGGMAALAGNFTTLFTSVLFPFLTSKYTDKQRAEYEQLRLTKYTAYLQEKEAEIRQACRAERELLLRKHPSLEEIIGQGLQKSHLWERRPMDSDFMQLRLGTGQQRLSTLIDYPPRRFELETDELEEKMYRLAEQPWYVDGTPILMDMMNTTLCALQGQRELMLDFVLRLVIQIAATHSYDEVKIVLLGKDADDSRFEQLRYLPHLWDDQQTMRCIATTEPEAYAVGEYIQNQLERDGKEENVQQLLKNRPFYLVFALDKRLLAAHEVWKDVLQSDAPRGIAVVTATEDILKETQRIITLKNDKFGVCTTLQENGGDDITFALDDCDLAKADQLLRLLSNTRLKTAAQAQTLPNMVTFMEMLRTGRIEQLNPLKRWQESDPVKSLAAPVGVHTDGSLFMLDLHEKRQGPHGLVAGMTGSGKSEFIITYILSMAVNYHPDEVAFLLIDYKGGGLAGAFENPQTGVRLPHLAGTITNLDGASIQRSFMSIQSELMRRQRVFNETKSAVNEGTIDIYAYQKLCRAGRVTEPMPHLFIISDEFAELKQQQPEFMTQLISAARIGRSLGVHLILATQKPSGVVDDQIRSNTKFRVCLRVQEKSDSMDMLKRPEAAELTQTGRFYLQVGYNEYFALGQSAWCGASYGPQDAPPVQRDDAIIFLDGQGQPLATAKPKVKRTQSGKKQIVAVVEYLSELAASQGVTPRQLCLPVLPDVLPHSALPGDETPLQMYLGRTDDPENQQQLPYGIDLSSCGSLLVVGDVGSGKTWLLQRMLHTLTQRLSPKELNFYALDYSSRMMKLFEPLPHCGGVLYEEDSESLDAFFKMINGIVAERKRLFAELEVDNFEAARNLVDLPLILVLIDGYAGLSSSKIGEQHSYKFASYAKGSTSYGVKYIVTCSHLNEVASRARMELTERIALQMKDRYDYGDMLNCRVNYVPPEKPGRCLVKVEGRPLECQLAALWPELDEKERVQQLKEAVNQRRRTLGSRFEARSLPVFAENAEYADFIRQFKRGRIPLGISKQSGKAVVLPLKQMTAMSIYFGDPHAKVPVFENLLHMAEREEMQIWILRRSQGSVFAQSSAMHLPENARLWSNDDLNDMVQALSAESLARNEKVQQHCAELGLSGTHAENHKQIFSWLQQAFTPILLLIESLAETAAAADLLGGLMLNRMLSGAYLRGIYAFAGFDPDDKKIAAGKALYSNYNPEKNALLLGGRFDQQHCCSLPEAAGLNRQLPCNSGLIRFHKRLHPFIMPCGDIAMEAADADDAEIF